VIMLSYVCRMFDGFLATIVAASSISTNTWDGFVLIVTLVNPGWSPRETVSPLWNIVDVLTRTHTLDPSTLAITPTALDARPLIGWSFWISTPAPARVNW